VSDEKNPNIRYQGLEVDGFVPATNGVEAWVPRDFRRIGFDRLDVVVKLSSASGLEVDLDTFPGVYEVASFH
jgi:hypothetical protein